MLVCSAQDHEHTFTIYSVYLLLSIYLSVCPTLHLGATRKLRHQEVPNTGEGDSIHGEGPILHGFDYHFLTLLEGVTRAKGLAMADGACEGLAFAFPRPPMRWELGKGHRALTIGTYDPPLATACEVRAPLITRAMHSAEEAAHVPLLHMKEGEEQNRVRMRRDARWNISDASSYLVQMTEADRN